MTAAHATPGIELTHEALIGLRHIATNRGNLPPSASLPGGFSSRKRGHGQEMADVREYVPGDDIRHLDRGSTARTGIAHIRTFHEERDRATLLIADFRPAMLWGTRRAFRSVAAAEALTLIGWRAVEEGGRVGLLALTSEGPVAVPARGRTRGMLAVIGGLVRGHALALEAAMAGVVEDPHLSEGMARAARLAPVGAEVIVASGFDSVGPDLSDHLGRLAQRRILHLLEIADGGIDHLPAGAYPIRLPDGTRKRIEAHAGTEVPPPTEIAGVPATRVDAGAEPEQMTGVLAAIFSPERGR